MVYVLFLCMGFYCSYFQMTNLVHAEANLLSYTAHK